MFWEGTIEYYNEDIVTAASPNGILVTKKYCDANVASALTGYLPLAGGTMTGDLIMQSNVNIQFGNAPGIDGDVLGKLNIRGTNGIELDPGSGETILIGNGAAGSDYSLTFDGETNDGIITWMEDEDYFKSSDKWVFDLGWDANQISNVTVNDSITQVTGLNVTGTNTGTGSFRFSTGGLYTAQMSNNATSLGEMRGIDGIAALSSSFTASSGTYFLKGVAGRVTTNANSHTAAIRAYSGYFENPGNYTATTFERWALMADGDLQVNSNNKLILEGSVAVKGDTYFLYDSSGTTMDCFVDGAEVWNANGTTFNILDNTNITGSLQCDSIVNDTGLAAGTYTATRSAETNLDSNVSLSEGIYMRVGNVVTVTICFTADPTLTATTTSFEISLPIASNFSGGDQLTGTAVCGNIAGMCAQIASSATNNTAKITWKSTDITSQNWFGTFTYRVI